MKLHTLLFLSLSPLLALAACGSSEQPASTGDSATATSTAPALPTDLEGGAKYFATTCTPCHGAGGKGDGAASAALDPKPRDLTDSAWQATIEDDYLLKIIQYGGSAVGKQPTMPPNPVLASKPEVLNGLVAYVRSLAK